MQQKPSAGSASVEAVCVNPSEIDSYWPTVAPWLRRAMERGDLGLFKVVESDVKSQGAILWVAKVNGELCGAAVTQIQTTERSRACVILACGGSGINSWLRLLSSIEQYGRTYQCDLVRFEGRKGWTRLLPDYRTDKVIMERRL